MKKSVKASLSSSEELFTEQEIPSAAVVNAPLAVRMRPQTLDEVVGQGHLLSEGRLLRRTIQSGRLSSLILYGPPGSGKTSTAKIISKMIHSRFISINAVSSNVAELRQIIQDAQKFRQRQGMQTVLFIDEIHRFNRAQQDVLMPDVEEGTIILVGATTHNPSFVLNGPLLSRALVCELHPLSEEDIIALLKRSIKDEDRGLGKIKIQIEEDALKHLAQSSAGDARRALNALEVGALTTPPNASGLLIFDLQVAQESSQRKVVYHDREGDYHYDLASAFIKSMRGSDADASVYWLAKMLYAGEEPRFIIRRIMILASEDIGNADPQALILASAGLQAVEFIGMPEVQIILSQLVIYMALAPKSNASYLAISKATDDVRNLKIDEVPSHLRDSHYPGAKKMGHGEGYQYAHNFPGHFVDQEYKPTQREYYHPTDIGFERVLSERLSAIKKLRKQP